MIGDHTVTLTPDPATPGITVDLSCLADEVTIRHGREDTDSQPEAASATLDLSSWTELETFPTVEVGAGITVRTTVGGVTYDRFVGLVTDVALGWDSAEDETPDRVRVQVVATAVMANLGRRTVGDVPWPQELDGARVARIMAAAGVVLDGLTSDPGTVQILARDVDSQAALPVAQDVAANGRGVVWHTRSGEIRYADADHRRGTQPAVTLDACDLLVSPTWRRTTEGLVNDVSIGYGPAPDGGGEQPRYLADAPTSVARYGRYDVSLATQLALLADAMAFGQLLLVRNSSPVWLFDQVPLDLKGLSAEESAAVLGLEMHSLVSLIGLPAAGAAPTSADLWVEGWTERLAFGEHSLDLAVSGYCRTVPAPRWNDVDPARTWDSTSGTWDDATCMGRQPDMGRWLDVPASLRWDTAGTTWDGYGG